MFVLEGVEKNTRTVFLGELSVIQPSVVMLYLMGVA